MSSGNHYETLGLSATASDQDIKKAYRALALKYHPDRNPGHEETFKRINEAYEVLSCPESRKAYDHPNPFASHGLDAEDVVDINHMFNMMFGQAFGGAPPGFGPGVRIFTSAGPGQGQGQGHGIHGFPPGFPFFQQQLQKPPPILKTITITLEQCYHGCSVPVEIEKWVLDPGSSTKTVTRETLHVTVPPGIQGSEYIVLRGRGNVTMVSGGEELAGDVKIGVEITNSTGFERVGLDLIYAKTVTLKEALCGFTVEITHLNGKLLRLTNQPHTSIVKPHQKKVIPGMGMTRDGTAGNLIIDFDVTFPDQLTEEQVLRIAAIL